MQFVIIPWNIFMMITLKYLLDSIIFIVQTFVSVDYLFLFNFRLFCFLVWGVIFMWILNILDILLLHLDLFQSVWQSSDTSSYIPDIVQSGKEVASFVLQDGSGYPGSLLSLHLHFRCKRAALLLLDAFDNSGSQLGLHY